MSMTHYEQVVIPSNQWTEGTTRSEPATNSIHCGMKCSKSACFGFNFVDGVCRMSDSWVSETTEKPSVEVFREKLGQYQNGAIITITILEQKLLNLCSELSKPQLNHNSTQPNITLSWVRHENDFANHPTTTTQTQCQQYLSFY